MKSMRSFAAILTVSLGLAVTPDARATVTGQWDFNSSNLTTTVGADLEPTHTTR